jgi:glycosyltransferase involved in cell wall biosynthesis
MDVTYKNQGTAMPPSTVKKITLGLFPVIIIATIAIIFYNFYAIQIYNLAKPTSANQKIVVLVCMLEGSGGTERCTLIQQREFLSAGIPTILVTKHNGFLADYCKNNALPVVTCSAIRISSNEFVWMPGLNTALQKIVKFYKNSINVIHCSQKREVFVAKKASNPYSIPVVLTRHNPGHLSPELRKATDGIICVSKDIARYLTGLNENDGIKNKIITALPPFFDYTTFLNFNQTQSRNIFFKETFGITLKPCPLLVKIAHLYFDVLHKNHPLLFQAMHKLIYRHNIPVQVALAGGGANLAKYKKIVHELKLDEYVYFLGNLHNSKQAAAVLSYADINLLASSNEAFGIVLMEGGIMKKPTICARSGCGAADWLIIDGETGFLFENKNAADLADKIAFVLSHQELAQACGQKLYEKIMANFLPAQTAKAIRELYAQLHAQTHSPHGAPA